MSDVTTISVGEDYDVLVGHGVSSRVAEQLPEGVARVLVVHGAPLAALAEPVISSLRASGLEVHVAAVPDAEAAKTVEVAAGLWSTMGARASRAAMPSSPSAAAWCSSTRSAGSG